jgi:hypothetical protein
VSCRGQIYPNAPVSVQTTSLSEQSLPAPLRLRCLIEREATVFTVEVSVNDEIGDLKKLIHKEKDKGSLRDVNAADLVLLKVSAF